MKSQRLRQEGLNHGELLYDGSTKELKDHYVHTNRVEVISEPSMEEIISEIYHDAGKGIVIGSESKNSD